MDDSIPDPRRVIPAPHRPPVAPAVAASSAEYPRAAVAAAPRVGLGAPRASGEAADEAALLADAAARLGAAPGLRRVLNAPGVVLHTGLGRAPLAPAAMAGAPGP